MAQDLALWKPSTALSIEQEAKRSAIALKYATTANEAFKQVKQLIAAWPHANPPNPEGYAASLAAVLAQYPLGVVQECCDVRSGLARTREFPPTPAAITEWCDHRLNYHRGMVKWGKLEGQRLEDDKKFTPEHCKSMLRRWSDLLHGLLRKAEAAE